VDSIGFATSCVMPDSAMWNILKKGVSCRGHIGGLGGCWVGLSFSRKPIRPGLPEYRSELFQVGTVQPVLFSHESPQTIQQEVL